MRPRSLLGIGLRSCQFTNAQASATTNFLSFSQARRTGGQRFYSSLLLADNVCHKNGYFFANLSRYKHFTKFPSTLSVSGVISPHTLTRTDDAEPSRLSVTHRSSDAYPVYALATFPMRQDIVICSSAFPLRPVEPRFPIPEVNCQRHV